MLEKAGVGKLVLYLVWGDTRESWSREISLRSSVSLRLGNPGVGKLVLDLVCDTCKAWCRELSLISNVCHAREVWCRKLVLDIVSVMLGKSGVGK